MGVKALAAAAQEPGATQTGTGLVVQTLEPGEGPSPTPDDKVKVHYEGTVRVLDASNRRESRLGS